MRVPNSDSSSAYKPQHQRQYLKPIAPMTTAIASSETVEFARVSHHDAPMPSNAAESDAPTT